MDTSILYEVTGYPTEGNEERYNIDWEDFAESDLVRLDKDETHQLERKLNKAIQTTAAKA